MRRSVHQLLLKLVLPAAIAFSSCQQSKQGTNYYFDPQRGIDAGNGTIEKPFKSLSKIRSLKLFPGDSILLKSGAVFNEPLYVSCKGDSTNPVVIAKYNGDEKPHIEARGQFVNAVHVFNSEHIVLRDLEISNKGKLPIDTLNGVLVELVNYGTAKNTTLENLFVHDVFGGVVKERGGGNAIRVINYHDAAIDTILSRFDGLLVENCIIRDCRRNGIMMWGNWIRNKWFPSLNVIIRKNLIEGVPGDGIVPVGCESPLVEHNVMRYCPALLPPTEACDGIWPWGCDNAVIQYNAVSDHKSQVDGYGFDSDWNCNNSVFRYNLSYNNEGGFLLLCNSGGWPEDWSIGNKGTIVHHNLSINDGLRNFIPEGSKSKEYFSPVIHITGPTKNSLLENNLFYVFKKPAPQIDKTIVSLTDWGGYPDSTAFSKNFFFVEEANVAIEPSKSTNNFYSDNIYKGKLIVPASGFTMMNIDSQENSWYNENDRDWKKLVDFVRDKEIPINGKLTPVLEIIGLANRN